MHTNYLTLHAASGHLPPAPDLVLATQRLRGAILATAVQQLRPDMERPRYDDLNAEEQGRLARLSGKGQGGEPTAGNQHLALLPVVAGDVQRVIAYKRNGFDELERTAVLAGSRRLVRWGAGENECVRFVPVPFLDEDAAPLIGPARVWQSQTPFVPPPHRHRFRRNGKAREGESPARQIALLCAKMGYGEPESVDLAPETVAVLLHRTWEQRRMPPQDRGASRWPGFWATVRFAATVRGPLFLGHSCHFGLGVFCAIGDNPSAPPQRL